MFLDSISVLQGQPLFKAMLVWEAWWPKEAQLAFEQLEQLSFIGTKPVRQFRAAPSILDEQLTTLDVIRSLGQSILIKHQERADTLSDKYVGSRVWVDSTGKVQGLIEMRGHTRQPSPASFA